MMIQGLPRFGAFEGELENLPLQHLPLVKAFLLFIYTALFARIATSVLYLTLLPAAPDNLVGVFCNARITRGNLE